MSIMYPPDDGPPIPDGPPSFAAQLEASDRPPDPPPPDDTDAPPDLSAPTSLSAQPAQPVAWPTLAPAALYGLPGHVVDVFEPHTEADSVAVLLSFLVAFGSAVGPGPHAVADGAPHPARLYAVLVGETARARKGTSWANVRPLLAEADPAWSSERILGGLASGEGLIACVSQPNDDSEDGAPPPDPRLLVVEPEYARLLSVAERQGNTLSAIVRQAWDSGDLDVTTRKDPLRARGAHVSIVGHVTLEELRRRLLDTEAANGFANRFLYALVRRSKLLPSGGRPEPDALAELAKLTAASLADARTLDAYIGGSDPDGRIRRIGKLSDAHRGVMVRTPEAEARWADLYMRMAEDAPAGLVGAVTARAEAQVLRLSVAYALTDASPTIRTEHLEAAWAMWSYCEQSAAYIFGDSLGDEVADRLLEALEAAGTDGLDGTAQRAVFSRHVSGARLDAARKLLEDRRLAVTETEPTGGRPRTVTYALKALEARKGSGR